MIRNPEESKCESILESIKQVVIRNEITEHIPPNCQKTLLAVPILPQILTTAVQVIQKWQRPTSPVKAAVATYN